MPLDTVNVIEIADPDGQDADTVEATIEAQGATVARETAYSDSVPEGDVISHTIEHLPVEDAIEGTLRPLVTLTVSLGPEPGVTVPFVVNLDFNDAIEILTDAGLLVAFGPAQESLSVALNAVISHDPPAGAEVEAGSTVTLILSLGFEEEAVVSPVTLIRFEPRPRQLRFSSP